MRTPAEIEILAQSKMYNLETEETGMSADVNGVVLSSPHPETHIFTNSEMKLRVQYGVSGVMFTATSTAPSH